MYFNLTSKLARLVTGGLIIMLLSSCVIVDNRSSKIHQQHTKSPSEPSAQQIEIDKVYTLLAFAVVYKDWQVDGLANPRGHNIGSVLVNQNNRPVFWARNANAITSNGSQHGEVRLIHNYLDCSADKYLKDYTVYTTLEPCAMCTGMMSLTKLTRAVYGQKDPEFGDALERLALNSKTSHGGYKPYPRLFSSIRASTEYTERLEKRYKNSGMSNITAFLRQEQTRKIFEEATQELLTLKADTLKFQASKLALTEARKFYRSVSDDYVEDVKGLCQ